jgi:hypothetical protein
VFSFQTPRKIETDRKTSQQQVTLVDKSEKSAKSEKKGREDMAS